MTDAEKIKELEDRIDRLERLLPYTFPHPWPAPVDPPWEITCDGRGDQ
jgi:hypothetical protein